MVEIIDANQGQPLKLRRLLREQMKKLGEKSSQLNAVLSAQIEECLRWQRAKPSAAD